MYINLYPHNHYPPNKLPHRDTRVSCFSQQHLPTNQFGKHLIVPASDRGKDTVLVFVDFLCNNCPGAVHDIIGSDEPSSEFKNKIWKSVIERVQRLITTNN